MPSPSIILGTPTLSRFSSSFLSSSLTRRHTPESLPSVAKPLISKAAEDEQLPTQRRSSHSLLPSVLSRRSSIKKDEKPTKTSHEFATSRQSSFGQAVLNGKFEKTETLITEIDHFSLLHMNSVFGLSGLSGL